MKAQPGQLRLARLEQLSRRPSSVVFAPSSFELGLLLALPRRSGQLLSWRTPAQATRRLTATLRNNWMNPARKLRQTLCVSFSGVDGAGKSTQIEALRVAAENAGLHVRISRFWDDVACLTLLREASGHKIFKGDKGIGSPEQPVSRRDKNVRSLPMSCIRLAIYTIDALSTHVAMTRARRSGADLFIFDRYLYDELANLSLENPVMRLFVHIAMVLTPRPDISFVLDADPEAARARKPEYPIEFIRLNRQAYLFLARILGDMTIIQPMPIEDVKQAILNHVLQRLTLSSSEQSQSGDKSLSQPVA
jgi:thymidylate kinase